MASFEQKEKQPIPKTLYHGTNLKWWEMRKAEDPDNYTNPDRGIVILSSDLRLAFRASTNRASMYHSRPIILVINSDVAQRHGATINLSQRPVAAPYIEFDAYSIPTDAITAVYDMTDVRQSQLLFPEDVETLPEIAKLIE